MHELRIPIGRAAAGEVVASAAGELGWSCEEAPDGRLEIREDATRLHCHCSPLRAIVETADGEGGGTRVEIAGEVPGWGPLASRHVREQTDLLTRRIALAASRLDRAA